MKMDSVFDYLKENYRMVIPRIADDLASVSWEMLISYYNEAMRLNISLNENEMLEIQDMCIDWTRKHVFDDLAIDRMNDAIKNGEIVVFYHNEYVSYGFPTDGTFLIFVDEIEMYVKHDYPLDYIRSM